MRIAVADAVRALGAEIVDERADAAEFDGVSYDSRTLARGNLFVAVVAERDGHEFVTDAATAGCAAVLVSSRVPSCGVPQIVVDDTVAALAVLGRLARDVLDGSASGRVVGITGSVGKTSTKDFAAAALSSRWKVAASEKSLNNDQGLPVTLLNAPADAGAVVLEMGMRGFGEIARLAAIARPDIGIVTRVGESHSERVGGVDGVRRAKSELVTSLPDTGWALLNADDPRVSSMSSLTDARVLTFGESVAADMRVVDARVDGSTLVFDYASQWGDGRCRLPVPGVHMATNAAAALLAAAVCGCDVAAAADSMRNARMSPMRMAVHAVAGRTLLDDSYNSSPTSAIAALNTLAAMPAARRIAVLGTMAEIDEPERRHRDVAAHAVSLGIEVVAFGTDLYGCERIDEIGDAAERFFASPDGSAMLVKASRSVGLDRVVSAIVSTVGGT